MVIWSPGSEDNDDCVWLERARVGEVGGNTLGFYGCQFSPTGHSILAHGYQGSFHLWHYNQVRKSFIMLQSYHTYAHFFQLFSPS